MEGLVRLHAHIEYSTHAEATQAIGELSTDERLRPTVISRLGSFLGEKDDMLLSTTLLVLEDLLGTCDKAEAATNASEMFKANIQSKVEELARYACLAFVADCTGAKSVWQTYVSSSEYSCTSSG